jgi:hypothetical protein
MRRISMMVAAVALASVVACGSDSDPNGNNNGGNNNGGNNNPTGGNITASLDGQAWESTVASEEAAVA